MRTSKVLWVPRSKQTQGFTPEVQYAAVNTARTKRQKRAKRNAEMILSGGYKQIPILSCP